MRSPLNLIFLRLYLSCSSQDSLYLPGFFVGVLIFSGGFIEIISSLYFVGPKTSWAKCTPDRGRPQNTIHLHQRHKTCVWEHPLLTRVTSSQKTLIQGISPSLILPPSSASCTSPAVSRFAAVSSMRGSELPSKGMDPQTEKPKKTNTEHLIGKSCFMCVRVGFFSKILKRSRINQTKRYI